MSRTLSPETLIYDLRAANNPQVSPDGTRILYALSTPDRATRKLTSHLWTCAIDGGDPRQLTWGGDRNGGGAWSPDGRQIAFVSNRVAGNGIFVMPADSGGEAREVARHMHPIGDLAWSPDGTRLAYTVAFDPENPNEDDPDPDAAPRVRVVRRIDYKQDNRGYLGDMRLQVFVVDLATRTRQQVSHLSQDHTSPCWSPDGRRIAARLANRNGMCSQLVLIDPDSVEGRIIGPELGTVSTWAWAPDGDRIVFTGDTAQTLSAGLFVYDVARDTVRRIVEDLPFMPDAGFPTVLPPAQPVWIDRGRILCHAFRAGASMLVAIDVETGAIETVQAWSALHAGLSVDAARRHVVQAHTSLDSIGEIVVTDLREQRSHVITALNADVLREAPPARWEAFTVERGGYTIDAWLLLPPAFDPAKRYPLVLDVHGGPHGYYGYGFNAIQQCLAGGDFLVVFANPRGSGSYGGEFARQVVGDWAGEDYRDLQAVVDRAAERPYVDPERIGIFGYSYGGYMTAWTIGQTDRFRAAVCGAPVFECESFYGTSDIGHVFGDHEFGGEPHQHREWYAAHSPSTYAHQARTPTLIIHGEADDRCPIGQGEQMFVALRKAGCEVEFVRYPGASHLFLRSGPAEHRHDVLTRVVAWFKHYLGEPR